MRRILYIVLVVFLLSPTMPVGASSDAVQVYYQGSKIIFDVDPVIQEGTAMVQFRPIFEKLGMSVSWDSKNKRVTGEKDDLRIDLYIGNNQASAGGKKITLPVAPMLVDGNTMVPLRFVAEASGKIVKWDESSKAVYISKGYEADAVENPYGGESFIDENFEKTYSGANTYLYEKDGYLYVMWYKEVDTDDEEYGNFYVSIGKDGKWIKKNQVFSINQKFSGITYKWLYEDGSFYWMSADSITKFTPSVSGYGPTSMFASDLDEDGYNDDEDDDDDNADDVDTLSSTKFRTIYIDGAVGVLFFAMEQPEDDDEEAEQIIRLYDGKSPDSYIPILDKHGILKNIGTNVKLSYDSETRIMNIYESQGYRMLDTATGELVCDDQGQDKVVKLTDNVGTINRTFYNGNLYHLYQDGFDSRYTLTIMDKSGNLSEGVPTQIKAGDISDKTLSLSFTEDSIHIWSTYTYDGKPCVQKASFSR